MKRRVLIIAGEFPPMKAIGRLRPIKMCQHLPSFGWDAGVLSIDIASVNPRDEQTLTEIPYKVPVFRATMLRPLESLVEIISEVKPPSNQHRAGGIHSPALGISMGGAGLMRHAFGRMKAKWDYLARRHLMIPDDWCLWIPLAFRVGLQAIRTWKPDLLFTTAPPFTSLIIGKLLKAKTGIPWVADYRDLWTGDVLREWLPEWRKRFELRMERRVLANANAVITVSRPKEEVLRKRICGVAEDRFHTITNGFDIEEYESVEPEKSDPKAFRIVYTGRLFKNRRGYELLEAIARLIAAEPSVRSRLRLEYYGGMSQEIEMMMCEITERLNLQDVVRFFPDVPYGRSKALQKGADALLLIVDTGETTSGVLPGKLFEYMAAKRPVLCIARQGAATEIVENARLGWVSEPNDIDRLVCILRECVNSSPSGFNPDEGYLAGFERKHLIGRMAEVFNLTVSRSKI